MAERRRSGRPGRRSSNRVHDCTIVLLDRTARSNELIHSLARSLTLSIGPAVTAFAGLGNAPWCGAYPVTWSIGDATWTPAGLTGYLCAATLWRAIRVRRLAGRLRSTDLNILDRRPGIRSIATGRLSRDVMATMLAMRWATNSPHSGSLCACCVISAPRD